MYSPKAQDKFALLISELRKLAASISEITKPLIVANFEVPAEDIACSAVNLVYAEGEADVQIEIRYTAGIDMYRTGETFDPSTLVQHSLIQDVLHEVGKYLEQYQMNCSVWTKPYRDSSFEMTRP